MKVAVHRAGVLRAARTLEHTADPDTRFAGFGEDGAGLAHRGVLDSIGEVVPQAAL
jgi:hypothetical protein